jgi:hypothetical protein
MRSLGFLLVVALAGCDFYFNDGDDDCAFGAPEIDPGPGLRNPDNGNCESFGGFPCDSQCGPCPLAESIAAPDWGSCASDCEGLIESTCIERAGCRAVYLLDSPTDGPPSFMGCWAIAPSGPAGGSCENLDAYECSRRDHCSGYYSDNPAADPSLHFAVCKAENAAGCFGDDECGETGHCSTSDGECLPPPGCEPGQGCPAVCFGRCIDDGEVCAVALCEAGTTCHAECDAQGCHPVCVPDVACASLLTETACTGRSDCRAVYDGTDCTCYENGTCECQVLTYESCEAK